MRLRKVENISECGVTIELQDGNSIYLPPKSIVENVEAKDLSGVQKYLKVNYDLGEVKPFNKRLQLRG